MSKSLEVAFQIWQDEASPYERCDLFANFAAGYAEAQEQVRLIECLLRKEERLRDCNEKMIARLMKELKEKDVN